MTATLKGLPSPKSAAWTIEPDAVSVASTHSGETLRPYELIRTFFLRPLMKR
jgi:hypothetical protein